MADALCATVTFERAGLPRVALSRVALVEAVADLGSISAAARKVGLRYKSAGDAVQALNNLFDGPLVTAAPGGKAGGAAAVTPRGRAVIEAFHRVQAEMDAALVKLDHTLAGAPAADLFWSLGMKTSARNALRGRIAAITPGAVNSEVTLRLADGLDIVAVVTAHSLEDLGLELGAPAIALIKSSFIVLARGQNLRTSARNQLEGVVASREDGTVMSEIRLDIGAGKSLVAGITLESANALEIAPGDTMTALIKAPHVILAVE